MIREVSTAHPDTEKYWDEKLHINTAGRDETASDHHHFPYEPTPYAVLQKLAGSGWIQKENFLLDYGSGKGRAGFFLSGSTGCRSMGIEFNSGFYLEACKNRETFTGKGDVSFLHENAEKFTVPAEADRFYFFNPFSEKILGSVISRILESWYLAPRHMLLMFYYPSDEYVAYLMGVDELTFFDEEDCSDIYPGNKREKILCFETSDSIFPPASL